MCFMVVNIITLYLVICHTTVQNMLSRPAEHTFIPMIWLTLLGVKKFARKMNLILLVNDFNFRWVFVAVEVEFYSKR